MKEASIIERLDRPLPDIFCGIHSHTKKLIAAGFFHQIYAELNSSTIKKIETQKSAAGMAAILACLQITVKEIQKQDYTPERVQIILQQRKQFISDCIHLFVSSYYPTTKALKEKHPLNEGIFVSLSGIGFTTIGSTLFIGTATGLMFASFGGSLALLGVPFIWVGANRVRFYKAKHKAKETLRNILEGSISVA